MKRENLQKMADYIKTVPQKKFNMDCFFREWHQDDDWHPELDFDPKCESIGCVIGHCTVLDSENIMKNHKSEFGVIQYVSWSMEFTGLNFKSDEYFWCFSWIWKEADNTTEGAAKRIEYLLKYGLPENWEEIMNGKEPICY